MSIYIHILGTQKKIESRTTTRFTHISSSEIESLYFTLQKHEALSYSLKFCKYSRSEILFELSETYTAFEVLF